MGMCPFLAGGRATTRDCPYTWACQAMVTPTRPCGPPVRLRSHPVVKTLVMVRGPAWAMVEAYTVGTEGKGGLKSMWTEAMPDPGETLTMTEPDWTGGTPVPLVLVLTAGVGAPVREMILASQMRLASGMVRVQTAPLMSWARLMGASILMPESQVSMLPMPENSTVQESEGPS